MGLLLFFALGLIGVLGVASARRALRDRRVQSLQSRELHLRGSALKAYVYRLPDFRFTHCLVSRDYRTAVALEETTGRLCLIDAATPSLYHRIYAGSNLLEVSRAEEDHRPAESSPDSTGYILLGGAVFGWLGALGGYLFSTKDKAPASAPMASALELRLKVNDTRTPLWRITFLVEPLRKSSPPYRKARETALQWQALLGVIRQRGIGVGAAAKNHQVTAGSQHAAPTSPSSTWNNQEIEVPVYQIQRGGREIGAMLRSRIRALLQAGHLAAEDLYFDAQLQAWLTLDLLPDS